MRFLITDLDYTIENNTLIARCYGRFDDGSRGIVKIYGTRAFFFIRTDEAVPDDPRVVEVVDSGWKSLKTVPLKTVYVRYPKDVAERKKCINCDGKGVIENDKSNDNKKEKCTICSGDGMVELGLRVKFKETWQADVVYTQVLRIYYGLVGEIEVPGMICHISDVRKV